MERARIKSPVHGLATNTGPLATAAWCLARGLSPKQRDWFVEVALHAGTSKFAIEIYSAEWGFAVHHDARESWIRVTDIPFVHGKDDHELLSSVEGLGNIGKMLRAVEQRYELVFPREAAVVTTNIDDGMPIIREWVASL